MGNKSIVKIISGIIVTLVIIVGFLFVFNYVPR